MGTEKSKGFTLYSLSGHVDPARPVRGPARHHAARAARPVGRRPRGPRAEVLDARAAPRPRCSPPSTSTSRSTTRPWSARARCSAPRRCRSSTRRRASCAACCAGPSSTSTSPAASARRAARARTGSCRCCDRLEAGEGSEADLDTLLDLCDNILGRSFCALGDGATSPITSAIQYFRDEFEAGMHTPAAELLARTDASTALRGGARLMTVTTPSGASAPATDRAGHADHRRHRDVSVPRARWSSGPPSSSASRSRGSATTRCSTRSAPAASASSRSRASASRWRPARRRSTDGMVVRTQLTSAVADKAQQGVMEMLLINHPLDCPVCDKGGECPLQNQAMSNGRGETRFDGPKRTFPKPIPLSIAGAARPRALHLVRALHPVLRADRRRPVHRAARARRRPAGRHRRGRSRSTSYFSGNTVQICPVGALTGAAYRFRSRPFDLVSTPIGVRALRVRLRPAHRPPARQVVLRRLAGRRPRGQRGVELRQGPLGVPLRHAPDRITTPAGPRRRRARSSPTSWPDALDVAARGLAAARDAAGCGVLAGGRAHARGRLRVRQVRPRRARHQRRRLPRPAALGRGGGASSPRTVAGVRARRHLRRPRERARRPARRPRARGGVADRLPAAAQGGAPARASRSPRVAPFATRGLAKLGGHAAARRRPAARPRSSTPSPAAPASTTPAAARRGAAASAGRRAPRR